MSEFFYSFMDKMPMLICVAHTETNELVYLNSFAKECFAEKSGEEMTEIVDGIISQSNLILRDTDGNDGKGRWLKMQSVECYWHDGKESALIVGVDHSKYVTNEELLAVAAYADALTGIYNRRMGLDLLAKLVRESKEGSAVFTMCVLKLDDLHVVNEKHGHNAGDQYVLMVSDYVKRSIRKSDIFARIDAGEFLLIFPKCPIAVATAVLQEVSNLVDNANSSSKLGTYCSINYGVLEVRASDNRDMEALLDEAGAMMSKMKEEQIKARSLS